MRSLLAKKIALLIKRASFLNHNPKISLTEFCDLLDSRRTFLKQSALVSTGLFLGGSTLTSCASLCPTNKNSKVIILGAGMSGLTAAYYLTKAQIPCEIYESSERTGGRTFSRYNFNSEQMYCELGGELIDSNNQDIINLCRDFSIEIDAFAEQDTGFERNLYFIKNKLYRDRDLLPAFQKFVKQLEAAKAAPPEQIDKMTLAEFLKGLKGVPSWLIEVLRVAYVGESGVEADQQSALIMISTIDSDFSNVTKLFGDSDEALKIRGGNTRLTSSLEKFLISKGVVIHFGSPLVAIKELSQKIEMQFAKDTSTTTVKAERVICTIPFSRLRQVDGIFNLALSPLKKTCIQEMKYATNAKMMLGFTDRPWRNKPRPHSNGMVYTDLFDQNLWETSRLQSGKSGILTSFTGGIEGAKLSSERVLDYLSSIDRIFPGSKKIFDSNTAVFNWSQYKHTLGSYAVSAPGQMTQFGDISGQPELGGSLLFAGEHATKEFTGFINGAALSGRKAAERIFTKS